MSQEEGLPPQEALFDYLNDQIACPLEDFFVGNNRDVFHQQVRLYVEENNLREARKKKAWQAFGDAQDAITKECQDLKSGARKRRYLTYSKHPSDEREWLWQDARLGGCGWIRRELIDEATDWPGWWERPFSEPTAFAVLMALHDKIRPSSDPMLPDDVRASPAMQDLLCFGLESLDLGYTLEAVFVAEEDAKDPRTFHWGRRKADVIRSYFKYVQQYFGCDDADTEALANEAGSPDAAAGLTQGKTPGAAAEVMDNCTYAADFTSVVWYGTRYTFNKTQARCIGLLWTEWEKGGLTLGEEMIAEKIDSDNMRFRLRHVFRVTSRKGRGTTKKVPPKTVMHPAWGTMVVPAGKGIFRLTLPKNLESPNNPT